MGMLSHALSLLLLRYLRSCTGFGEFDEAVDAGPGRAKHAHNVGGNEAKGRTRSADKTNDGHNRVGLVALDNGPETNDEKYQRHDQAHAKVDQDLHQDFEGKFQPRLVTTPSHAPKAHKHHVPHGLAFGELLAPMKILPKGVLHFAHADLGENSRDGLGIRHARLTFLANLVQNLFLFLHALFVPLTGRTAIPKPSFGGVVGLLRPGVGVGSVVFRLQINRVHDTIVLPHLLLRQSRPTPHKDQNGETQKIGTRNVTVPTDELGGFADDNGGKLLRIGQSDNLSLIMMLRLCLGTVHGESS